MSELSDQQREFCRLVVAGQLSHGRAYRQAFQRGEDVSDAACRKAASRLLQREEVQRCCEELRKPLDKAVILDRQQRMQMLSALASSCAEGRDVRGAVACVAELNRMDAAGATEGADDGGTSLGAIVAALVRG